MTIEEMKEKIANDEEIKWKNISEFESLSEDFIREFQDKVEWNWISNKQKLSEDFIREFQDKVDWTHISIRQTLSENFIREFQGKVDWYYISCYQKFSEDFIRELQDEVNWGCISVFQKLSEDVRNEFKLEIPKTNWLYTSNEEKMEAIKDCKLYEIDGEYVIAYKGIRSDNYSVFNFRYKYELGETYEAHCDYNNENKNSFGLSVWTLDKAREYCSQKIVKVKIHISDIGALVHDCHKIRCSRMTVLEEVE